MKVLTLKFEGETHEVHLLNVGEMFPADFKPGTNTGFGGSKHPLIAGSDYASGKKRKKPTASLVIRRTSLMGVHDIEREITDPHFWAWMARMLNGDGPDEALVDPRRLLDEPGA